MVDEAEVEVADRLDPFAAGEDRVLDVELEPGQYILICNVPGHYQAGMHVVFRILAIE